MDEKLHYAKDILLNGHMINYLFYCHIVLYWDKLTSKLHGKFQRFNAIDGSIEMVKNGWISKMSELKWKIVK